MKAFATARDIDCDPAPELIEIAEILSPLNTDASWSEGIASAPTELPCSSVARNLRNLIELDSDDLHSICSISHNSHPVRPNQVLFHERDSCDHITFILDGMAYKYKMLSNGRRQILGYLIPGDFCDVNFLLSNVSDHGVAATRNSRVANMSIHQFSNLLESRPNVAKAVSLARLRDSMILREWLLSIGRRDAFQRLSHFFCELVFRLITVGRAKPDGSIALPINQVVLADTIGSTPVHVNRTLQRLRADALVDLRGGRLHILNYARLAEIAEFDDYYLRLPKCRSIS